MSLNTLWEAAKYVEMQEHQMLDTTLATTTTIRPVTAVNGGITHVQNGTGGATQTFTLHPVKLLKPPTNTTTVATVPIHQQPQQQPTTVVISSTNISSTLLHGPISIATASPTTVSTTPQNGIIHHNGTLSSQMKKEQDGHISSTTISQNHRHRVMQNSFDIMNSPLIIDESGPVDQKKIKQPPLVFRSGTREVHNKLEKHRRAHLKECFDLLKKQLPSNSDEKKTSNLSILHSALRHIHALKRREHENERELERLAREKINNQQRLTTLKKDLHLDNVDFSRIIPEAVSSSTNSITQNGTKRESVSESLMSTSPSSSQSSMSPTAHVVSPSYTVVEPIKMDAVSLEDAIYCDASDDATISGVHLPIALGGNVVTVASAGTATVSSTDVAVSTEVVSSSPVINQTNSVITTTNGESKISIPILGKTLPILTATTQPTSTKEVTQPVQTTGISVLPMSYPVNQGLVLQKVAILPHKGLTELAPLMITTPQQLNGINGQINGKVVPLTQYIVKPMVVVSTASPRPGS